MHDQLPTTLRSLAGLPADPPELADSTLVIIDAQQEYLSDGLLPLDGVDEATATIASVLEAARSADIPVRHVVHEGSPGGLFDPAVGGQIIEAVAPEAGEIVIRKTLPNAFAATDLNATLQEHGQRPLVIVGFMTHMCVSATARAALDLGIPTTVLADATATRSLPSGIGESFLPAHTVHQAALAALADRFSIVTTADKLIGGIHEVR